MVIRALGNCVELRRNCEGIANELRRVALRVQQSTRVEGEVRRAQQVVHRRAVRRVRLEARADQIDQERRLGVCREDGGGEVEEGREVER